MSPLRPLLWHFWGRFFDNDLISPGADPGAAIVKLLGVLATPGLLYPLFRFTTYLDVSKLIFLGKAPRGLYEQVVWPDRMLFLTLAFVVLGLVALLEWDALYLDARDYVALMPLPLTLRTLFFAKILSLGMLAGVFAAAVNLVGSVTFPLVSSQGASALDLLFLILAQLGATICASLTAFLLVLAMQGLLSNLLPYSAFRRAGVFVQLVGVVGLLTVFVLYPDLSGMLPKLRQSGGWVVWAYPPFLFLGLEETLAGTRDPLFEQLAGYALAWLVGSGLMAAATYSLSYKRHLRRTLEAPQGEEAVEASGRATRAIARILARTPVGNGVLSFMVKTIARSGRQRLMLCASLGVGVAFAFGGLVIRQNATAAELVSVPLVISFFAISGLRYIFTLPAELAANLAFRVSGSLTFPPVMGAIRWTMFGIGVLPVCLIFLPVFVWRWGWQTGVGHDIFVALIAALMVEILLIDFRKVPFTCAQRPGKNNVAGMWALYWVAFTIYAHAMARMGVWLAERPGRMIVGYFAVAMLLAALVGFKRSAESHGGEFDFEDAGDPAVLTLDIS